MKRHENLRVHPDGTRMAEQRPEQTLAVESEDRKQFTWFGWLWRDDGLTVELLTDDDVEDWLPVFTETDETGTP